MPLAKRNLSTPYPLKTLSIFSDLRFPGALVIPLNLLRAELTLRFVSTVRISVPKAYRDANVGFQLFCDLI